MELQDRPPLRMSDDLQFLRKPKLQVEGTAIVTIKN